MNEQADLDEIKRRLDGIEALLRGSPYDRNDRGVLGNLQTINEALWGPEGRPNGVVGMMREMRVTTRTMIVGLVIAGGGVVLQQWLG